MLTDEHKQKSLAAAHQFLQRHQIEGDQSLDHIVIGDETWISYTNWSQSDGQCNGATHRPQKQRSSNKHLQSEKSWPLFSGTERGSCLLIF